MFLRRLTRKVPAIMALLCVANNALSNLSDLVLKCSLA